MANPECIPQNKTNKQKKIKLKKSMNARNFLITMNKASMEGYENTIDYLKERGCNYLISCLEENKKEELHIHIYVQFPKQVRLSPTKCHKSHIDVCRGTEEDNINYVKKIATTFGVRNILEEYGTLRKGVGTNQHTVLACELKEKAFPEVEAKDYNTWQQLQGFDSLTKNSCYKPDTEVYYIYGPSGTGKSKFVFDQLEDDEQFDRVKFCNGFWHGVNVFNQPEVAWYDEFRSSHMQASEFINFIDYYVSDMNIKYHTGVKNRYKKIFITSIEDPTEIYRNLPEESRLQWLKRIKILNMEEVNKLKNN